MAMIFQRKILSLYIIIFRTNVLINRISGFASSNGSIESHYTSDGARMKRPRGCWLRVLFTVFFQHIHQPQQVQLLPWHGLV